MFEFHLYPSAMKISFVIVDDNLLHKVFRGETLKVEWGPIVERVVMHLGIHYGPSNNIEGKHILTGNEYSITQIMIHDKTFIY